MWDAVEICAGRALWHVHKTIGFGHVCSLDTTSPKLTFTQPDLKVQGRVTQVQPRNKVYQSRCSPTKYSHIVPAGTSTWAGSSWHGLPKAEVRTGRLGKTCSSIPLTYFLIRTEIKGPGFDPSTLLVT